MKSCTFRLLKSDLDRLLAALKAEGYRIMAPTANGDAVSWDEINSTEQLPWGIQDVQAPGRYRLDKGNGSRCFDIVHGPQSLKPLTFAPCEKLCTARQSRIEDRTEMHVQAGQPSASPLAVIGARACDLAALAMQEKILMQGQYADPHFSARRNSLFIIAVHCTRAAETCFCASMQTGPRAETGFDIALTELDELFLVETGSPAGERIMDALQLSPAGSDEIGETEKAIQACAESQSRSIDQDGLPEALYKAHNHPHWDDVARRCLSCANCTMVCPTCFCHAVEEVPDLDGGESSRYRIWDSCFSPAHGYIHGKNMRPTNRERYRMWLTHKLGSWIGQFGASGCVGCGRCISWCPVGIDITHEYARLRRTP